MEFAIVDGSRQTPKPKSRGTCAHCGNQMLSKCGTKVIWHWAHASRKHCDPWWENETDWHRKWKSYFPPGWREQRAVDSTNEAHIADIRTPKGVVLEFQNSPISPEELQSREQFYGDMTWIVNGDHFASSFHVLSRLPRPDAEWLEDIEFFPQQRDWYGTGFWLKSENPNIEPGDLVRVHMLTEISAKIDQDYVGHHFYHWVKPRTVWLASRKHVYIDFGDDFLWLLLKYGKTNLLCVQIVQKSSFIAAHGGLYNPTNARKILPARLPKERFLIDTSDCDVLPHLIR